MTTIEITIEITKLVVALGAGAFAYYTFFREGTHKQRIEFDIDCIDLGAVGDQRIIEIGCTAENKGNIEQRFDDIRATIRGLSVGQPLNELGGHQPRLAFPIKLGEASLIPSKWQYFFVRPKVKQRFPIVIRIPATCSHIHVRSTFQYKGTDDVHSAERAFQLPNKNGQCLGE